jgi:rod shape-determining protein MreC
MNQTSPGFWRAVILTLVMAGIVLLALSGFLGPALRVAFAPFVGVQSWLSQRYAAFYDFVTVPRNLAECQRDKVSAEQRADQLQTEIVQLQQQLREAQVLYSLLDFARARPEYQYVAAAVIGRDPSPFLHYVFIDHGSDDEILHGMPVVTQKGLVGRIDAVTAGAARLQLLSDPGSSVNVRLQNSQVEAMLVGSVTGDITIQMVPQDVDLQPGELILTSGLGGNYPRDIVIGQVLSVRKRENELFQTASVQPAVDFASIRAVLIIKNFKPANIAPLVPTPMP